MRWLMFRSGTQAVVILSALAVWAGAAAAAPVKVSCEVQTCDNGKVLCRDVIEAAEEPSGGPAGGLGLVCKKELVSVPCSEILECPKGTPAFGGVGLALLALGLVSAGAFAARRHERS